MANTTNQSGKSGGAFIWIVILILGTIFVVKKNNNDDYYYDDNSYYSDSYYSDNSYYDDSYYYEDDSYYYVDDSYYYTDDSYYYDSYESDYYYDNYYYVDTYSNSSNSLVGSWTCDEGSLTIYDTGYLELYINGEGSIDCNYVASGSTLSITPIDWLNYNSATMYYEVSGNTLYLTADGVTLTMYRY